MKGKSAPRGKNRVVSKGGKAPANGITKGKSTPETTLQKDLKKWPPKLK